MSNNNLNISALREYIMLVVAIITAVAGIITVPKIGSVIAGICTLIVILTETGKTPACIGLPLSKIHPSIPELY